MGVFRGFGVLTGSVSGGPRRVAQDQDLGGLPRILALG
jgi:hypothetical protein